MRLSLSMGSLLGIADIRDCVARLSKNEPYAIWIPETWGMENFAMLSAVAARTSRAMIGSSIINTYSRSPSLIGMGAVTVDTLSGGRLILGLGTSSMPIVEDFHGYRFERPVSRMREYIQVIRLVTGGGRINYRGDFFNLKNFTLLTKPFRERIPIYLAAVNRRMVRLTWEVADGAILYLRPRREMRDTVRAMQSKRRIDVACQIITAVSEDSEAAAGRARKTLAFYVAVGKVYREFLAENGYGRETAAVMEEYGRSGLDGIGDCIPDGMLRDLTVCGTPDESVKQLGRFRDAGVDLPILQFNPVDGDDVGGSFALVQKTFLEGGGGGGGAAA